MDKIAPLFDNPVFKNTVAVFLLFVIIYVLVKILQRGRLDW